MGVNHCISGVNWASLKKFAKFLFGEDKILGNRIVDNKYYILYLEKNTYNSNKVLVDKFENEFLVSVKPME